MAKVWNFWGYAQKLLLRQHLNLNEFLQAIEINLFTVLYNNKLATKILNGTSAMFFFVS
jgi:hypothetical protein